MLMICEDNSFNSTPKEVDIDTTSSFNNRHRKIMKEFLNKVARTVTIQDKKNVLDITNNKDVICDNKNKNILIEKQVKSYQNLMSKNTLKKILSQVSIKILSQEHILIIH